MIGKVCMITGASSGMGKATALELARLGADLVLVCRDQERGEAAVAEIARQGDGRKIDLLIADLASQQQVRRAASAFLATSRPLHVLVNNAGLILNTRTESEDGLEMTFAINHIGYFLLTNLLLERIKQSAPARIVNVASMAHRMGHMHFDDINLARKYSGMRAYAQSKLANILFTRELARRLEGTGVTVNAVDPGPVASGFGRNNHGFSTFMMGVLAPLMPTPTKGAKTAIYLSASPEVEGVTGKYFAKCKEKRPTKAARSDSDARKLWELSQKMTDPTPEHRGRPKRTTARLAGRQKCTIDTLIE